MIMTFQVDNMLWQMQDSPMQQLLDDAQREVVADVVNAALLASASGKPKWEVKPQVRKTFCTVSLSLCSFMITSCQSLQQFLGSLLMRVMQCKKTLHSHFLGNDTSLFPLTFECMSSHNQGHKHAS